MRGLRYSFCHLNCHHHCHIVSGICPQTQPDCEGNPTVACEAFCQPPLLYALSLLSEVTKQGMDEERHSSGLEKAGGLHTAGGSSKEPWSRKDSMVKTGLDGAGSGIAWPCQNNKHIRSWKLMRGSRYQHGFQWWLSQKLCQSGLLARKLHSLIHKG